MSRARAVARPSLVALALATLAACGPPADEEAAGPTLPVSYPETATVEHVDDYHGVEVADPYRWLEELESEETAAWIAAQNAVAEPFLAAIAEREGWIERLTELWNYERYRLPVEEGGRYFYRRNDGLQDQDVLYVADSLDGEPRVLIDPNTFSEDATVALSSYVPDRAGERVAYSVSDGGSDWRTWRVREVGSGEDLADELTGIKFSDVSWAPYGTGFYYSRYPEGTDGEPDGSAQVAVWFHRLGTGQAEDRPVYSIDDHPTRNPYAQVTEDGRWLILGIFDGYDANGVYYRPLEGPDAGVVRLLDEWDALYTFLGNVGDTFYFHTNLDAPRWRVVAVDLARPERGAWREVVPESELTMESVQLLGGSLVASYLEDARSAVRVFSLDGEPRHEVHLPGLGSVSRFSGDPTSPEAFYLYTSFTTPGRIYRYDVERGESRLWRESEVAGLDPDAFAVDQVFYRSADGTRVPMFVVHRRELAAEGGPHPTLLYGYGGFNVSLSPSYSSQRTAWLERGGVLAVANLRGGGEYGEAWHEAGTKLEKQNVFDDFVAAAEWLIESGWTAPEKLGIRGGSNGGLLVGAVMTQRPDLFGAALPAVGVLDMLRYHTASANARQWSSDYGLADEEEEFAALLAYSPVHNVEPGTCYPPTLVTTADHDDRVVPWHSYKFAAALQAAQGCDAPVLLRVETRAGHGAGKPTWMQIENAADQLAFLAWALEAR